MDKQTYEIYELNDSRESFRWNNGLYKLIKTENGINTFHKLDNELNELRYADGSKRTLCASVTNTNFKLK